MKDWKRVIVTPHTTIRETIQTIDTSSMQIAIVVDTDMRLLGTVTDGDVRRAILKGVSLENKVEEIMNSNPLSVNLDEDQKQIFRMMQLKRLRHIPIVDNEGRVEGIKLWDDLIEEQVNDNWVILMAGGLGSRLQPLTNDCPKPLLKIGSKPILETILENFIEYGFHNFYISVNYRAEMIKDYFGDGSRWGVQIRYIHEDKRMGTAGALSLLPEQPSKPIFVMNGDILTKVNFQQLLDFHNEHEVSATMCVREYDFQVPYGVVKVDKHRLMGVEEKPVQHFFVNAGIYVLDPNVLQFIPSDHFYDMPSLYQFLIKKNYEAAAFPIREYWLDIGRMDDFERATGEFQEVFKND
jgi:dTDP-glucose pyrophosphorylase